MFSSKTQARHRSQLLLPMMGVTLVLCAIYSAMRTE